MTRRLLWQLFPSYLLVAFFALSTYVWIDLIDLERFINRGFVFLISISVAALLAAFLTRLILAPIRLALRDIRKGAELFSKGELARRLSVREPRELYELAHTLNKVGAHLKDRINSSERQSRERNAILEAMREGVIVLDKDFRLIRLNPASERLLNVSRSAVQGKLVHEIIRNASLQRLLEQAINERKDIEGEVTLYDPSERSIQVYARVLADGSGIMGMLVVLNDLTRINQLENVRKEFVANVSHELRTPITSIKGFVETLLDGALSDADQARRFLEIIARQVDRLDAIFDDLLSLSRIEQQEGSGEILFERVDVAELLNAIVQVFEKRALEKKIELTLDVAPVQIVLNRNLIEQAISNLLDNAIKLSPEDSQVQLKADSQGSDIVFSVADNGPGIEKQHLARIFERFYRVDKGRSRKQGGTGLGLSIVKHIAQVHQGSVDVKSQPGEGSTFYLRIPKERSLA